MSFFSDLLDTVRGWFQPAPSSGGAMEAMQELKRSKGSTPEEWTHLTRRLATLVFSEADRQRLWKRAHRTSPESARLLSGITAPSPEEIQRLRELVAELESGR